MRTIAKRLISVALVGYVLIGQSAFAVNGTVAKLMTNAPGIVYFSTSDCPFSGNQWSIAANAAGNRNMLALLLAAKAYGATVRVGAASGSTACPTTTTAAFWIEID